jgi:hypothetical protein
VFDKEGCLLEEPSIHDIRLVRQICLFGKKVQRECSHERLKLAVDEFRQCDDNVVSTPTGQLHRYFKLVAAELIRSLSLDGEDFKTLIVPMHGPGATRERIMGNQKYVHRRWHKRLDEVGFTYFSYGRGSTYFTLDDLDSWPDEVEPEDEEPVRVVFVPKTLKRPRVIAVEPVCMQYAQQGLSRLLVQRLERGRLTGGHVNFRDQSVNQSLAQDASASGKLATLDMSEASDRVSLSLVCDLLDSIPVFRDWVLACRSTRAELPNGDIVTLKKFASMGSALCFPVESLVFFTSIIASRLCRAGQFPTAQTVYESGRDVYVYGDDLILPANEALSICDDLESLGFKVNRHKSFWTGKFRESCGSDCYDGELVTPVYLRRDCPTSRGDVSGILSCLATCNQLFQAGYTLTAAALRKAVEKVVGRLPEVPTSSPALGWNHYSEVKPSRRWNSDLQKFEFLCLVAVSPRMEDPLEGDSALAKCFRLIGLETVDTDHLVTSPRPYGLALKRRWVSFH